MRSPTLAGDEIADHLTRADSVSSGLLGLSSPFDSALGNETLHGIRMLHWTDPRYGHTVVRDSDGTAGPHLREMPAQSVTEFANTDAHIVASAAIIAFKQQRLPNV
jgi:hypothetical protein